MAGQDELRPTSPDNQDHVDVDAGGIVGAEGVEVEDAGAQEGDGDGEEEGRAPARVHIPHQVSQAEREEHEITHTPYRTWCRFCVQGRRRRSPHRPQDETTRRNGVPKVSLDYFFLSEAVQDASPNPVLVMLDESTGERYARAVGRKGVADWLIKDLSDGLKSCKYNPQTLLYSG